MTGLINIRRLPVSISVKTQINKLWARVYQVHQVLVEVALVITSELDKCNHTKTKPVGRLHFNNDKWKRMKMS